MATFGTKKALLHYRYGGHYVMRRHKGCAGLFCDGFRPVPGNRHMEHFNILVDFGDDEPTISSILSGILYVTKNEKELPSEGDGHFKFDLPDFKYNPITTEALSKMFVKPAPNQEIVYDPELAVRILKTMEAKSVENEEPRYIKFNLPDELY